MAFVIKALTENEFRSLAELRYQIRKFIQDGDTTAREVGLEPQQYLLLLALRGLPPASEASIRTMAERMSLQHHSAVELVDRMEQHGYVKRTRSLKDRRQVLVSIEPRGEKLLQKVARKRVIELRSTGYALVRAISALLEARANPVRGKRKYPSEQ
jgi:DNA-binding MarR family transcriptional regulator